MARKKNAEGKKKEEVDKTKMLEDPRGPLVIFADAALGVEKVRVSSQVRLTHLGKRNMFCPQTDELRKRAAELEEWVDNRVAQLVESHPAAHWFNRVKGTGGEMIGKTLGLIQGFGRFYEPSDPMIPPYVKREPVMTFVKKDEKFVEKPMVWVSAIERFPTPSKLRKFAGLVPGLRKVAGKKLEYNDELKMMLWRLGGSFLKSRNKYAQFYDRYKQYLLDSFKGKGIKVVPTPLGRYCKVCDKEVNMKAALHCPICNEKLSLKQEPEGVIFEGHVHLMAQRRMMQLFLNHLWVVWREAEGLPLREPYPMEHGHSGLITPEEMCDN